MVDLAKPEIAPARTAGRLASGSKTGYILASACSRRSAAVLDF